MTETGESPEAAPDAESPATPGIDITAGVVAPDIDPAERQHDDAPEGVPVEIAGRTWILAYGGLRNGLDALRDRMHATITMRSQVAVSDVREAGVQLLLANYRLEIQEAVQLVLAADLDALQASVVDSMLGGSDRNYSFTDWAVSGLIMNGIDPASVHPRELPIVLTHLVKAGRVVQSSKFTGAGQARASLNTFRGFMKADQ